MEYLDLNGAPTVPEGWTKIRLRSYRYNPSAFCLFRPPPDFLQPAFDSLGGQSKGYGYALAYSDSKIPRIINNILEKSKNPPIIILEGDHGPFLRSDITENLSNLTVLHFGRKINQSVLSDDRPGQCI